MGKLSGEQAEQPLENKRKRMLSSLFGKSISCRKLETAIAAMRFSYLVEPLAGLHDTKGRLKSLSFYLHIRNKSRNLVKEQAKVIINV